MVRLRSIQAQIMLWTLFLGLVPLIVLGIFAYTIAQDSLRDSIQNGLESVVDTKAEEIEVWLDDTQDIAENLAVLPTIRGDNSGAYGLGIIDRYGNITDVAEAARQTAYDSVQPFIDIYGRVEDVLLVAPDGEVLISTFDLIPQGSDARDFPTIYFEEGRTEPFLSDVTMSIDGETLVIIATHPVQDHTGQWVGSALLRVNTHRLQTLLSNVNGLGDTGETYLANLNPGAFNRTMITQSRFDTNAILNQEVNTFAVEQALNGITSGKGDYEDYQGVSVLGVWNLIESPNWLLLGEIYQSEAYTPVYDLSAFVLFVVVVAATLITIVAYLVSRTIARPLVRVAGASTRLADGNLQERVNIRNRNEVGQLATAFNTMADNLQMMVESERHSKQQLEKTISEYMDFVSRITEGDLRVQLQLNSNGKIPAQADDDLYMLGANLNAMVANLRDMAGQVREASARVSSAAMQIQAATTQQTASATEQDVAMTQTVATVEEVRATVVQTSERAQAVADASQQSVMVSRDGQQAVNDTVGGMDSIRGRVESIAENILMLSERTQQIGEIIDTVNALADQSKLLALNASIEAARAGEEGKGFAVVAMEVRQLAEQSREATARVRDILSEIQQATNTAVMVTEEGSKGAESGMSMAQRAGEAIRELAGTIEQASEAAMQIAASAHQQTNGMDQLADAMMQIKQATTQTAASTKQTEQSVRDLTEMAQQLERAAARYEL